MIEKVLKKSRRLHIKRYVFQGMFLKEKNQALGSRYASLGFSLYYLISLFVIYTPELKAGFPCKSLI